MFADGFVFTFQERQEAETVFPGSVREARTNHIARRCACKVSLMHELTGQGPPCSTTAGQRTMNGTR